MRRYYQPISRKEYELKGLRIKVKKRKNQLYKLSSRLVSIIK